MTPKQPKIPATPTPHASRRDFLKFSTAAVGAALAAKSVPSVYAAENNTIKIGLIGCGGRGGGAAVNALGADPAVELIALADMFPDKLESKHKELLSSPVGDRVKIKDDHKFSGWDAYKGVIDACDVVLLATPPHFRPMHLKAVVEAGKHVFCEKPVAVDAPGVRSVMETVKLAKEKKLVLVSGLCFRYDEAKIETIKRIHDGQIGDIVNLQGNYLTGGLWSNPRKPEWSDMEWQLRNWLYFTWLSGDHIVEQHIHTIDKMMWVMKDEPPMRVMATGGRACRTSPDYGNVYDHFNTIFEWENGTRAFTNCRQWVGASADTSDYVYGTKGTANVSQHSISGATPWRRRPAALNYYDAEHVELFKAIRAGNPLNNGDYMCKSTMAAIMGRMSAYTGQMVKWDDALKSEVNLSPAKYEFGKLDFAPVAVPGTSKVI